MSVLSFKGHAKIKIFIYSFLGGVDMEFEIKWGLSGISDEQKAEVQTLIDNEAKIFSKNDKAIEYFKKSYTELSAEIEAIIPYQIAIFYIVNYLKEKMPNNAALKNAIQKVIEAFDGAYLWKRIKPLVPELQRINDEQIGEMRFIPWATVILQQAINHIDEIDNVRNITKVKTKRAKEIVLELSKMGAAAFDEKISKELLTTGEGIQVRTRHKPEILTPFSMEVDRAKLQQMGIDISPAWDKLTPYDRAVYNAVISLYLANCDRDLNKPQYVYITSRDIYCFLSGNKGRDILKPKPEMLQEIEQSLRRLSIIRVCINSEIEFKKNLNVKAKFEDYLLNTSTASIERNGKTIHDAIRINTPPVLFLYANGKNQIGRMPIKMLDTPVSLTSEYIETRDYLLRWVASIKNPKSKLCNHREYSTIYEDLGVTRERYKSQAAFNNAKADIREKIKKTLSEWKAQGQISDYVEKKEGNAIAELEIITKKAVNGQPSKSSSQK